MNIAILNITLRIQNNEIPTKIERRNSWSSGGRNQKYNNCHSQPKHSKTTGGLKIVQCGRLIGGRSGCTCSRDKRRGQRGRRWSSWKIARHINVDLLTSLAVAGDAAEKEVVATSGDSNGVISGSIGGQRFWRITWLVHCMCYSHHVVKLGEVLKTLSKINK